MNQTLADRMTETQFQTRITDLCDYLGLKWHHEVDSRKSKRGWPDLVIAGPSGVLFVELKTETGRISTEQRQWLDHLVTAGAHVRVWRPQHWADIAHDLKAIARSAPLTSTGEWLVDG